MKAYLKKNSAKVLKKNKIGHLVFFDIDITDIINDIVSLDAFIKYLALIINKLDTETRNMVYDSLDYILYIIYYYTHYYIF